MIFPFELSNIKHLVYCTNCLLSFEIDRSIYKKFQESLEREIHFLKVNKFDVNPVEPAYDEFNEIIEQCIEALEERKELIKSGQISKRTISFDEKKYQTIVYHI